MKVAIIGLTILLAALQYRLWFGGQGSVVSVYRLQSQVTQETQANTKLAANNHQLDETVARLKHSDHAIESRARSELGMIKGNETFYLVLNH